MTQQLVDLHLPLLLGLGVSATSTHPGSWEQKLVQVAYLQTGLSLLTVSQLLPAAVPRPSKEASGKWAERFTVRRYCTLPQAAGFSKNYRLLEYSKTNEPVTKQSNGAIIFESSWTQPDTLLHPGFNFIRKDLNNSCSGEEARSIEGN